MNLVSLWVIDLAEEEVRILSDNSLAAFAQFSWSPDGAFIAYPGRQLDDMGTDVFRLDMVNGENVNLTDSAGLDYAPAWSPDGASIVFVSDRDESGVEALWLMAADGSDAQRLTKAAPLLDVLPAWSPDGGEIAFFRRGTDPERTQVNGLWAVRPDGSGERLIVESGDLSLLEPVDTLWPPLTPPVWSPDGEWIAYMQRTPEEETDLYVVAASGGDPVQVTDLPGIEYAVAWTPDGQSLTFTYEGYDEEFSIYVVDREGGESQQLFGNELPQDWAENVMLGAWSPQ